MVTRQDLEKLEITEVYMSVRSGWWTHDKKDLIVGEGVPKDCFGFPLIKSVVDGKNFFSFVETNEDIPGTPEERVRVILAFHAQNIEWLKAIPGFDPSASLSENAKLILKSTKPIW